MMEEISEAEHQASLVRITAAARLFRAAPVLADVLEEALTYLAADEQAEFVGRDTLAARIRAALEAAGRVEGR